MLAINEGYSVVIENLGEIIDSMLEPVLSRSVHKKGSNLFLQFGGDEILYDINFELFLQTKLANPHYTPEISAQCTLINFTVTESGLEDQLLVKVVKREQPDLEKEKSMLQQSFNQYKIQLLDLENQLLERLSNAPDDILSDVPLIESLEATKETANEINFAVLRGKETELTINESCEVYRPVALEGSMLYFMMSQLCTMNHMYRYSLEMFEKSFFKAIFTCEKENDEDSTFRVEMLRNSLRLTIFTMISRGLFEAHKLIFLTQLTFNLIKKGIIGGDIGFSMEHMDFLLRSPKVLSYDNPIKWLNDNQWQSLQALIELEGFEQFVADLEESEGRFKEWYYSETPEKEKLPLDWRELDKAPFLKLLVIKCLRPDRMTVAITQFIEDQLPYGVKYTNCDLDLNAVEILQCSLKDMSPQIPIYFVLSPGTDVVSNLDKMAEKYKKIKGEDYFDISLGQGQDIIAMQKLQIGCQHGHWIILNNIHLMPKWLIELERKLDEYSCADNEIHEDFRLFISSNPSIDIPIGLISRSIKLTNEAPSGLKANLRRAFGQFDKEEIDSLETRSRGILFGMCYYHAIMIERKKYGSLGFNMEYPFASNDLVSSILVLNNYMEDAPLSIPWKDLRYLFGEIMYGGHIVNDFDRLLSNTYLEYFLRDEILDKLEMYPFINNSHHESFYAPDPKLNYEQLIEHIEIEMTHNTPLAFGFHPNSEILFRTKAGETLFATILLSEPHSSEDDNGKSKQLIVEEMIQDTLEAYSEFRFDLQKVEKDSQEWGPFQNFFLQECEHMNILLEKVTKSLVELDLGFRGDLIITEEMDELMELIYLDKVPSIWIQVGYPSERSLGPWLQDLEKRIYQLEQWYASPLEIPFSVWISGLFNPHSFLIAIMQTTSRKNKLELNKLELITEVTKRTSATIETPSRDGYYIHGLYLIGARWNMQNSVIDSSLPREMYSKMPVLNCKALISDGKERINTFSCPVYKTQKRGSTYVFSSDLRSKAPPAKWILGGVAMVMDTTE